MNDYKKPLPVASKWSQPFWDGAKQHKLLLKKCKKCGNIDHPPYVLCTSCWSDQAEWIQASGKGKIYAFSTVLLGAPAEFIADLPYINAMIDLAEGPRMLMNAVKGIKEEQLKIGMDVKIVFEDVTDKISLPRFTI